MGKSHNFEIAIWRKAADASPVPIAFVGGDDDTFRYCNLAWCKMLGYAPAELFEFRWQDVVAKADVGAIEVEWDRLRRGKNDEFSCHAKFFRKDGATVRVEMYAHRHPEFGQVDSCLIFAREAMLHGAAEMSSEFEDLKRRVLVLEGANRSEGGSRESGGGGNGGGGGRIVNIIQDSRGDRTEIGGDYVGRDKSVNSTKVVGWLAAALVAIASVVSYAIYALRNNPDLEAPPKPGPNVEHNLRE